MNQPLQEADERELHEDGSIWKVQPCYKVQTPLLLHDTQAVWNVPEERFQQSADEDYRAVVVAGGNGNLRGFPAYRFHKTV